MSGCRPTSGMMSRRWTGCGADAIRRKESRPAALRRVSEKSCPAALRRKGDGVSEESRPAALRRKSVGVGEESRPAALRRKGEDMDRRNAA